MTKWTQYAREKGINKRKKGRMVWDETAKVEMFVGITIGLMIKIMVTGNINNSALSNYYKFFTKRNVCECEKNSQTSFPWESRFHITKCLLRPNLFVENYIKRFTG